MDPTTEEEFHRNLLLGSARGHLQRASAASRASEPAAGGDSALSTSFLLKWCYGHRSAHEVNRDAIDAWNAGARGGYLRQLANLGARGTNPQNCARDLVDLVRSVLGLAIIPVYVALIPLFVTKSLAEDAKAQPELCPCGFILPHIWLWFLFTHHRAQFFMRFVGCVEAKARERISTFWGNVHAADPRRGPLFDAVNFVTHCIPIGLHGDGVPCTRKDSLDVTTLFSLLGVGTTSEVICYLWSFFGKCKVGEMTLLDFPLWAAGLTMDSGAQVILWSLQALETGLHPTHDHRGELLTTEPWVSLAGRAICDGYFGYLLQFRADADFLYNSLGLPGHWSSNHPCHSCSCDKVPNSPTNYLTFGPDASWPETIFLDMEQFFKHCAMMGKRCHPLLRPREEGGHGAHVFIFVRDTLHAVDLGVSQCVCGSVLWLLSFGNYVSADPGDSIRTVFALVNELYSAEDTACRYTNLELDQFTDPDVPLGSRPWLRGKAAETRHLVPLLRQVWEVYSRRSEYDAHVSAVLESLSEAYAILGVRSDTGNSPLFMTADASTNFRAVVDRCLLHTSFLEAVAKAEEPPLPLWHMVSKMHSFWHCGFESQFGHPSSGRTYINEDYMQHIRAVGLANRYGISASRRSQTVAERVSLGKSLELFLGIKP
jgi:hypothetical protein